MLGSLPNFCFLGAGAGAKWIQRKPSQSWSSRLALYLLSSCICLARAGGNIIVVERQVQASGALLSPLPRFFAIP